MNGTSLQGLLQEVWTVEETLVKILEHQANLSRNAEASRLYLDHLDVTREQKGRVEGRLGALGVEPRLCGGGFARSLTAVGRGGVWPLEALEREAQMMRGSYAIAQLECAMYRALEAVASRDGDSETALLARTGLREEETHARRLWPYVGLLAEEARHGSRVLGLLASG